MAAINFDGVPVLVLSGPGGAGKTTFYRVVDELARANGLTTLFDSDKRALGDQVLAEAKKGIHIDGKIITRHVRYLNPGSSNLDFQAELLDGTLLNRAHDELFKTTAQRLRSLEQGVIPMLEIAPGEFVHHGWFKQPTRQLPRHLIDGMQKYGLLPRVHVYNITSGFDERDIRNEIRPDHIPKEQFRSLFFGTPEFTPKDRARLNGRITDIYNSGTTEEAKLAYKRYVEEIFYQRILPIYGKEGGHGRGKELEM